MGILIYKNEQQLGPFEIPDIQKGLTSGQFSPEDLAWQEGCVEWVPLETLIQPSPINIPVEDKPTEPSQAPARRKPFFLTPGGIVLLCLIPVGMVVLGLANYLMGTDPGATQNSEEQSPSESQSILEVKGGTLNFDDSVKIGPAFEGYQYFKQVTWRDFETAQGRKVVEVSGVVDLQKYKDTKLDENTDLPAASVETALATFKGLKITFTAQFQLSQVDEKISVAFSGYTVAAIKPNATQPTEFTVPDENSRGLQAIFADQPDLQVSALLIAFSLGKPEPAAAADQTPGPTK